MNASGAPSAFHHPRFFAVLPLLLSLAAACGKDELPSPQQLEPPPQSGAEVPYQEGSASSPSAAPPFPTPPKQEATETPSEADLPTLKVSASAEVLIPRGGSAPVNVQVTRPAGVSGPVTLRTSDAPVFLHAAPRVVNAASNTGALVLAIDERAGIGARFRVQIEASSSETQSVQVPVEVIVAGPELTLDPTFPVEPWENDGVLQVDGGGRLYFARPAETDPSEGYILTRRHADGSLDQSFGSGGRSYFPDPGAAQVSAFEVGKADRLYVVTSSSECSSTPWDESPTCELTVARHLSSGALDPAFGVEGRIRESFGAYVDWWGIQLTEEEDGAVLLVAWVRAKSGGYSGLRARRWTANGTHDITFGNDGLVELAFAPEERRSKSWISSLHRDSTGNVKIVGSLYDLDLNGERRHGAVNVTLGRQGEGTLSISDTGSLFIQGVRTDLRGYEVRVVSTGAPNYGMKLQTRAQGGRELLSNEEVSVFAIGDRPTMALDAKGRILLFGNLRGDTGASVARFKPDPSSGFALDRTFGNEGVMRIPGVESAPRELYFERAGSLLGVMGAGRLVRFWP